MICYARQFPANSITSVLFRTHQQFAGRRGTRVVPQVASVEARYDNSDQFVFLRNLRELHCTYFIVPVLLYSSLVEELILRFLPLKKVPRRSNHVVVT